MVEKLINDSEKGKSLMESTAYTNGEFIKADIRKVLSNIFKNPSYLSYHLLFYLKKNYIDEYLKIDNAIKASIMCSAMVHVKFLNDWSVLDTFESNDGEAALALIKTNEAALKFLIPILSNNLPAPLFGSEEATLSFLYQYRRKDFAYRYVCLILNKIPVFLSDTVNRDELINSLIQDKLLLKYTD